MAARLPYVWDIDQDQFREMLAGRLTIGRLNRWVVVRLIEYAPYREIVRQLRDGEEFR